MTKKLAAIVAILLSVILNLNVPLIRAQEVPTKVEMSKTDDANDSRINDNYTMESSGVGFDTTFNGTGKLKIGFGSGVDIASTVAIQPDGKLVVAGIVTNGEAQSYAIARFNTDGSLDTTFDGDGIVQTSFEIGSCGVSDVLIQPDGKIVVVGYSYAAPGVKGFTLIRYNSDGSLDSSFDGDGKVITLFDVNNAEAYSAALQPNGKIVVTGYSTLLSGYNITSARYNTDGSLDTSFGSNGIVITPVGERSIGDAIAIQPDGKIVVAGYAYSTSIDSNLLLIRYNSDGTLDRLFGRRGIVITDVGMLDGLTAVVVQPDGKIVVGGYSADMPTVFLPVFASRLVLARYNPNGTLDSTFGRDGVIITSIETPGTASVDSNSAAGSIAIQADGKILVTAYGNSSLNFTLVRFNSDGSLDNSFDNDGIVFMQVGLENSGAFAVAIQTDGKIIVVGRATGPFPVYDFAVVRYESNGSLDTSFGNSGKVTLDIGNGRYEAKAMALQADGKMVIVGSIVARLNIDGTPDTTFGDNGKVICNFYNTNDSANGIVIQPDGKIIISINSQSANFMLARFNSDGSFDTSFGDMGKVVTDFGSADYVNDIALQPDGKIVAAGYSSNIAAVARYNSDGTLDSTFPGKGKFTTAYITQANSVDVQSDGKIIIAGNFFNYFAMIRFNIDGSFDNTFNGGGIVLTQTGPYSTINDVVLQPDGKIVAVGYSLVNTNERNFVLARYNTNGSLDTTFDTDGIVFTSINGRDVAYSVDLQSDGKIVVAGSTADNTGQNFGIVRYNTNGSLDLSFSTRSLGKAGKAVIDFGSSDIAFAVKVDALDRIIVAGTSGYLFAVARLRNNTQVSLVEK